jgi:hypothetical protein
MSLPKNVARTRRRGWGAVPIAGTRKGLVGTCPVLGDTFTSSRYIPDGNPLLAGDGGSVGAAILGSVGVVGVFRQKSSMRFNDRIADARHDMCIPISRRETEGRRLG